MYIKYVVCKKLKLSKLLLAMEQERNCATDFKGKQKLPKCIAMKSRETFSVASSQAQLLQTIDELFILKGICHTKLLFAKTGVIFF